MRIVMACPTYPPRTLTCGVGDYTRRLAIALAEAGERVTVMTSKEYEGRERQDGVTVLPLLDSPGWWRVAAADVVHLQYTPELYRTRRVAALPIVARPFVTTFHTLFDSTLRSRVRAVWLVAAASAVVSANEEVTGVLRRRLPWLIRRVTEIPIGSNVADADPVTDRARVRARLGLTADTLLIAHFGLVYPGKGLETLLDALARARAAAPRAVLVIVGDTRAEDRAYRDALNARARALGVGGAVVWTGRREPADVRAILAAADLYVVPYDDGVSIRRGTLLAGLAAGLPVVSTIAARPSAYLKDNDNVALVPPRDAGALAARIATLLTAPGERARLAAGARKLAERCAWPVIADEHRALYRTISRA